MARTPAISRNIIRLDRKSRFGVHQNFRILTLETQHTDTNYRIACGIKISCRSISSVSSKILFALEAPQAVSSCGACFIDSRFSIDFSWSLDGMNTSSPQPLTTYSDPATLSMPFITPSALFSDVVDKRFSSPQETTIAQTKKVKKTTPRVNIV